MLAFISISSSKSPGKPRISVYKIPVNIDGLPVIPRVDVAEATPSQMAVLLDEYFVAVWGKRFVYLRLYPCSCHLSAKHSPSSSSALPPASIPWEDITASPGQYYDTSLFTFPTPLKSPERLKATPLAIYGIYDYLLSLSASQPFYFMPCPNPEAEANTSGLSPDPGLESNAQTHSVTTFIVDHSVSEEASVQDGGSLGSVAHDSAVNRSVGSLPAPVATLVSAASDSLSTIETNS